MPVPTIENATVTEYVLYRISDYEESVADRTPQYTIFVRYICATASTDFSDIATMLETDIPEGAVIWSNPDNEETI